MAGESTAGQLSPLVVVYEALRRKTSESTEFMLISTESPFLEAFLRGKDIRHMALSAGAKTSFATSVRFFFKVLGAVFSYMPDVIFVKGGYVSLPVAISGKLLSIPILLHESDAEPRDINRKLARYASRIAVSFESTVGIYPGKAFFTGNPISVEVAGADRETARNKYLIGGDKPVIFIMSGGSGAQVINDMVVGVLPELLMKYEIIHQCGTEDYQRIRDRVSKMNVPFMDDYHLFPFLSPQSVAEGYAACDLVVSRAGANTVAEIMLVGKPSILIPLSSGHDNQSQNAFAYTEAGAAVMLNEGNLKAHLFLDALGKLLGSKLKIMEMMRAARLMAKPEAADTVADEIIRLGE